jgi:hypothetical protein
VEERRKVNRKDERRKERSVKPLDAATLKNTEEIPGAGGARKDRDIADVQKEEQEEAKRESRSFRLAKLAGGWALNKVTSIPGAIASIPSQIGITPSQIGARIESAGAKLGGVADEKDKNLTEEYKKNNEHLTKTEAGKRELAAKIRYANNHEKEALLSLQAEKDPKNIDRSAVYEPSFQRFLQARNFTASQGKLDNILGMNKDVYEESQKGHDPRRCRKEKTSRRL